MLYTDEAIKKRKRKTAKIKKTMVTLIYILLIPVLIYNVTLITQAIINPGKTPSFFGIKAYVIISGSMQPNLDIGDIVITKNMNPVDLQKNDIISFRKGQSIITHRITDIRIEDEEAKFRTKGDNNNVEDPDSVNKDQIEGKVIKTIPKLGKLVLTLKDKTVIIMIVIMYYMYLVKEQSIQKRKNIRNMKREEYERKKGE